MRRDRGRLDAVQPSLSSIPVPDYVAFDLETTGLSPEDDEILEVAMIRFSGGRPVERWSTLLNPGRRVPLKALRLTHIDENELLKSPTFMEVVPRIAAFRGKLPLVGHNSGFDSSFLGRRIEGFPGVPVYDTLELARIAVPGFRSYKLTDLAREMGVSLNDAHRAYDDAEVSGVIFALVQERVRLLGRSVRESVVSVMGKDWEPRHIFLFGGAAAPMLPLAMEKDPAQQNLENVALAADHLPVVGAFHGTTDFPAIAERFAECLRSEYGGYLALNVPLLPVVAREVAKTARKHAEFSGQRLLLVGFPESSISSTDVSLAVPENYLCLWKFRFARKIAELDAFKDLDIEERRFLSSVIVWGDSTSAGSFDEIQVAGGSRAIADELACHERMECRSSCPLTAHCHYLRETANSSEAGLQAVRLDKALALSRISGLVRSGKTGTGSGREITAPVFDRVIVWGAQDIHKTRQYSEERTDLGLLREVVERAGYASAVPSLAKLVACAGREAAQGTMSAETKRLAAKVVAEAGACVKALREGIREQFTGNGPQSDYPREDWADPPLVSRDLHLIERSLRALALFAVPQADGELFLVEAAFGGDDRGPFLVRRPVWPAIETVKEMEASIGPLILLSDVAVEGAATEGGRRRLGLAETVTAMDLSPATDFSRLSVLIPDVKVAATGPAFTAYVAGLLRDLSLKVKKGLLALFPSRALIKDVYAALGPELENQGIAVYAQGLDGGRRVVEHLEDDAAIVLATAGGSWDEEPVPTCLVVVKVQFPPPNPADDARRKDISRTGGDGFAEVNVRPSSLAIRSYAAKMLALGGRRAIVLCDPRLSPGQSKWAGDFLRAFDGFPCESGPVQRVVERVSRHLSGEILR